MKYEPFIRSLHLAAVVFCVLVMDSAPVKGGWEVAAYRENPTGLQLGFWANYSLGDRVLGEFGRRPIERVAFFKWKQLEISPGVFKFDWEAGKDEALRETDNVHLNGATMIANVNLACSLEVNPDGMDAIPMWYPQRISNPQTRTAAKRFLSAFVKEMLGRYGTVILAIDYEFPWFYNFKEATNRTEYRDWFVEASAVARDAAKEMGKTGTLRIMAIVNTNPFRVNPDFFGTSNAPKHEHLPWLQEIFDAADFVGLDIYEYLSEDRTDPEGVFRSVQYWMDNYSGNKPVFLTEVGMSTYLESHPDFDGGWKSHNYGTEEEQAQFYERLLGGVNIRNLDPNGFNNRLRGVCLWSYADNKEGVQLDNCFGLVRCDLSRKPAHQVVAEAFRKLESDPVSAPSVLVRRQPVPSPDKNHPLVVKFESGTNYEVLIWKPSAADCGNKKRHLVIETEQPGSVIICVNGEKWLGGQALKQTTRHEIDFGESLTTGSEIMFWFTSLKYPFQQKVTNISLEAAGR